VLKRGVKCGGLQKCGWIGVCLGDLCECGRLWVLFVLHDMLVDMCRFVIIVRFLGSEGKWGIEILGRLRIWGIEIFEEMEIFVEVEIFEELRFWELRLFEELRFERIEILRSLWEIENFEELRFLENVISVNGDFWETEVLRNCDFWEN
jgi:hypothetical protein